MAQIAAAALGFELPSITLPDTASVWRPSQVEVVTYHLRTCEGPAGAEVRYQGSDGDRDSVHPVRGDG